MSTTTEVGVNGEKAQEILGDKYFNWESSLWCQCGGVPWEESYARIPFSERQLGDKRETHTLFFYHPFPLVDIFSRASGQHSSLFFSIGDPWYLREGFAENPQKAGWRFIRDTHLPGSEGKTYEEQMGMLQENEYNPFACELFYLAVLWNVLGRCPFEETFVHCQDTMFNGRHPYLGLFSRGVFDVRFYRDVYQDDKVGLAVGEKPLS